ncbi:MAG: ATP-dependent DNA helicase RecG [Patescibacteria group bacterium]
MNVNTPIAGIGGIYKKYAGRLEKLGIKKLEDFLFHIPFRYEDFSLISKISSVQAGEIVTIQGEITEIKNEYTRKWKNLQKAKVADETDEIDIIWFNQPYIPKTLKKGDRVSLSGKVKFALNKLVLETPEFEVINGNTIHTGRLVPIYPETRGISSKWIRRQVYKLLHESDLISMDTMPNEILTKNSFMKLADALNKIHFPNSLDEVGEARKRLSFDELFMLQLKGIIKKEDWKKKTVTNSFKIVDFQNKIEEFLESLPFELTNAQKKAVEEILKDLKSKKPMNRLLEGDVGSGKTVVAAIAMHIACLNGFQSVIMAPTEILANQHFDTISKLLTPLGVTVALKTGSIKYKVASIKYKKEKIHNTNYIIKNTDILIGTHAVLSDKINFDKLGLVIIDEQQRFGVRQRSIIRGKGKSPHLLTMTATPIPRTIALTLYGDLDLSFLDEMPHGRKIVKTWLTPEEKRSGAYQWIEKELKKNKSQAFIICPFIEESETMTTVKAATKEFEILKTKIFPKLKLALLHGKLKSKEKEQILTDFKNKKYDILVATPVVEVGIDIPNATIMVIEASERFGLSQLHQLRGRVGRSNMQSYCLLFTEAKNTKTLERLRGMERIHIGAELAELDLRLRGPGEIFGTTQHGIAELKIASFSDLPLIQKAKKEAEDIFPKLKSYPKLSEKLQSENLSQISPD